MKTDPYDSWEKTELALKAQKRLVHVMCEIKPSSKDLLATAAWDAEMREVRKWIGSVHDRRISLNIKKLQH